jgi:hypothetical protein
MILLKGAERPKYSPANIITLVVVDGHTLEAVPPCRRLE